MSSTIISELIAKYGVAHVARKWAAQGVAFETAHLLLLGIRPRDWARQRYLAQLQLQGLQQAQNFNPYSSGMNNYGIAQGNLNLLNLGLGVL